MRDFFFAAVSLIIAASTAGAQGFDPRRVDSCKLIKDDAARLRCFDQTIPGAKSDTMPTPIGPPPGSKSDSLPIGPLPGGAAPATSATSIAPVPGFKPDTPGAAKPAAPGLRERFSPVIDDLLNTPVIGRIFNSPGAKAPAWQIKADKASIGEASQVWGMLDSLDGKSILALRCKDNNAEAAVSTRNFLGWDKLRVLYRVNDGQPTEGYWAATDGKSAMASAGEAIAFINSLVDNGTLSFRAFDYDGTAHDAKFGLGAISDLRSQIAVVCKWPTAATAGNLPDPQSAAPKGPVTPGAPLPLGAPLQSN